MTLGGGYESGKGRVHAGEVDTIWTPRTPRTGTCGVILMPGSGAPTGYIDPVNQPSSVALANALCSVGIPCITCEFGGQSWGNDTSQTRIDEAWATLKAAFPLMRTDKLAIVAGSMGAWGASRYCQANPTKVAAMVGLIPLLDGKAFYQANVGGTQSQVATAWGVTAPAALPTVADNAGRAALAKSVPFLAGYSSVDTTVLPAWVTSYAAAVGGTAIITDSTFGHSDAAVGGMPISTVAQFLAAHGV